MILFWRNTDMMNEIDTNKPMRISTLLCWLTGHQCVTQRPVFYPMAAGIDGTVGKWTMEPHPTTFCIRCGRLVPDPEEESKP